MPTLTSTGNVNLTSSTNWNLGLVPTDGDTLVLASGHTLTIDKDINLVRLTVNDSTTSRMVVSGTTARTVTFSDQLLFANRAGNDDLNGADNTYFCQVGPGQSLTIVGRHTSSPTSGNSNLYAVSSGTLRLLATDNNSILYSRTVGGGFTTNFIRATNSVLETRGLFNIPTPQGTPNDSFALVRLVSGVTYTHNHTGTINYAGGSSLLYCSGASTITWTGDVTYSGTLNSQRWMRFDGNSINVFLNGTHYSTSTFIGYGNPIFFNSSGGTIVLNGLFTSLQSTRLGFLGFSLGNVVYTNQTLTIPSDHIFSLGINGSANISGLDLTVFGFASFGGIGNFTIDANTRVNVMAGGQASSTVTTIPIIYTPNPAPTLPPANNVTKDVVYGYAASPITGTGLIVDPAILAAALSSSLQSALAPNAPIAVQRTLEDNKDITFSWPVSGAVITGQKSIDNGAYSNISGAISFLRTESGRHYYVLTYNSADRVNEEAVIRYKMTDGIYTKYFNLHLYDASPDTTINVTPAVVTQENTVSRNEIEIFTGESDDLTVYFYQNDEITPLDISQITPEFKISNKSDVLLYTIAAADITLGGPDNNAITFSKSTITSDDFEGNYSLRDASNGDKVLATGKLTVTYAP